MLAANKLSKNALRYILLGFHGITTTIVLILSALVYTDRIFIPSIISAIATDVYIPTTIYLAWKDPGNSFLTVGREVCYLLAQGLLVLILSVISALSSRDDTCSSTATSSSEINLTNLDRFDDIEITSTSNYTVKCRETLAVSILSFLHLLSILCWLGLLFMLVHRHRGHQKKDEIDAFNIPIYRFIRRAKSNGSSRFGDIEGEGEGDSTPIESLTKKGSSPISPNLGNKETKRRSTSSSGGSGTRINSIIGEEDGGKNGNKHNSTASEPWRISSLPLPDLKFHFDSARNSAKSTTSNGGGFSFSFSNSNPLNRISAKSNNNNNGFKANLPTLESTRNSIQSWRRGDDNVNSHADLESLRKDHKKIESWRISPLPLPDLNLGFDTKSTKSNKTKNNNRTKEETESIRGSTQSGLSGLTLEDARNSIQSLKSNPTTRDSLKSQLSANVPMPKNQKRESLEVPSLAQANQFRSTFRFNPDLLENENNRNSMETLRRDPKRIESWRISPIPWPTSRRNSEDQSKSTVRVGPTVKRDRNQSIYMIENQNISDISNNELIGDSHGNGDLGLGAGLSSINGFDGNKTIHDKRLSNIRNSAQSGFSLQHVRNSVRSQIGEVLDIQEHNNQIDNLSLESRSIRDTTLNDSFSSFGEQRGNRLSTFSANFNDGTTASLNNSVNEYKENPKRPPGLGLRRWGDSYYDDSGSKFSIGDAD